MALTTFEEVMKHEKTASRFIFRPGTKRENECIFSCIRIDRRTVPDGYYVYDIRGNDTDGSPCTIEQGYVIVNHFGSVITTKPIEFPKGRTWMYLNGRGGWSFG